MRKLVINREIVAAMTQPMAMLPKQITWQCHIRPVQKSFACQIRIPA